VLGLIQASFYVAVGLLIGVDFASGALGILVLFLFAAVISVSFGALGVFLALRTGSGEAIQGLFPLLFVFLFLSSMNTPRNLIGVDWFRFIATVNPVSYLIECVRSVGHGADDRRAGPGAGRAELAAFRRLLWAPGTTIDDHAQIEVESVRYNVVAGSIAPRRGPSGALDHYECDLMRATSG